MARSREKAARSARPGPAKRPAMLSSPKAAEIVALVEDLSSGLGTRDGVVVGRGLARLLARARPVPAWVKQLIAYYRPAAGRPGANPHSPSAACAGGCRRA